MKDALTSAPRGVDDDAGLRTHGREGTFEAEAMTYAVDTQWVYSTDALPAKAGHFSKNAYAQEIS